jgi:hypothetical protein
MTAGLRPQCTDEGSPQLRGLKPSNEAYMIALGQRSRTQHHSLRFCGGPAAAYEHVKSLNMQTLGN